MIHPYVGFIYVMTRPTGDVKIGISREPYQRLTEVRDNAADPLSVAAVWGHQHPRKVEAKAHRLLKEFETKREWFSVSKYVAFDAVRQAMEKVDRSLKLAPEPPEPSLLIDPPPPVDPVIHYDVPEVSRDPDVKFLLGYVRPMADLPAARQSQWMREAGAAADSIHIDVDPESFQKLDIALKDCRQGDGFMIWSSGVLGPSAPAVANAVLAKGAKLIYAST